MYAHVFGRPRVSGRFGSRKSLGVGEAAETLIYTMRRSALAHSMSYSTNRKWATQERRQTKEESSAGDRRGFDQVNVCFAYAQEDDLDRELRPDLPDVIDLA